MRKVIVKNIVNMTPAEKRVCYPMSYGDTGDLSFWLKYPDPKDKAVLVKDDGKIVGWGIRKDDNGESGYWVRTSHRRQGIGTKMVTRLGKVGPLIVKPHDPKSRQFFATTGEESVPDHYADWKHILKEETK